MKKKLPQSLNCYQKIKLFFTLRMDLPSHAAGWCITTAKRLVFVLGSDYGAVLSIKLRIQAEMGISTNCIAAYRIPYRNGQSLPWTDVDKMNDDAKMYSPSVPYFYKNKKYRDIHVEIKGK